nr:aldo/keto reductase [uncultured Anaeromusa sp.]
MSKGFLSGKATIEGTKALAERYGAERYRRLGRSGLWVSQAGFGSYRVDAAVAAHKEALGAALQKGINLIDTSANYADGGSERLIGEVLTEMAHTGAVRRDEMVLVSKVGYLQNSNLQLRQARQQAGKDFLEVVSYAPTLEHCIYPDFLEEQLELSLQRLQINCLDGFLLHNPEYYLLWALQQGGHVEAARAEYVRRLRQAVSWLEKAVRQGRIAWYGVSSNTFPRPADDPQRTPLDELWQAACLAGGEEHHFGVIQFPCNLLEPAAAMLPAWPQEQTLLEYAAALDLGVLINRPLNAIQEGELIRLDEDVYDEEGRSAARRFYEDAVRLNSSWGEAPHLRHLALRALRSAQGISAILVGMRRISYVADVMAELERKTPECSGRETWTHVKALRART